MIQALCSSLTENEKTVLLNGIEKLDAFFRSEAVVSEDYQLIMSLTIAGTGKAHPKLVVTNDMMSEIVETNDEWISTRTGIKSRYTSTDETLFDLTLAASKQAMKNADIAIF